MPRKGGKVQIEGVESVDPRLNPEVSHYEVVNTTDDSNPIGTEYDKIPDTWNRIVCDFPDMTQREIIPVLKCFDTGTGRVQIEGYKIFDYEMGTRKEWYRVKQSTDPENPVGKFITSISDDWVEVVCDFTDMEDRDIEVTVECYKTPAGKVKLEVLTSWDGNIGVRDKSYKVLETTDPSQPEGASFSSLPDTWIRVVCDFDDMEERDIKSYIECYDSGSGNVKLRRMVSYDSKIKARYTRFEVLESDDAGFVPGTDLATLPESFSLVPCDFTDMEDRNVQVYRECYLFKGQRIEVDKVGDDKVRVTFMGGGNGGGVLTGTIPVNPGVTYRVVVGDIGGDSIFGIYQAIAGKGGRGGYGVEGDGHDPSPGNPGQDGSYVFNNKYPDRYPYPMGAGGGSGAYTRGWDTGFLSGGEGGNHGGGDGAGVEDTEGVTINGENGGNATYYGGGGGGASKASNSGATSGRGGSGYRGIIILHYFKNG